MVKEIHHCDFYAALKIINQDFGLGLDTKYPKKVRSWDERFFTPTYASESPEYKLDYIPCEWTKAHKDYWLQYGIAQHDVVLFGVTPISCIISQGKVTELHDEIAFAFTSNSPYVKILRPFADKRSKWRNTRPKEFIDILEYDVFTGTPIEIITKSLKDVMVLFSMGITAAGVSSEGAIPEWYAESVLQQFKDAYILMDNDEAGKTCAAKWAEAGYRTIFIPEEYGAKDVSDLVLEVGFEQAKKIVYECLNLPMS